MDAESTKLELSLAEAELAKNPDNVRLILKRANLLRRLGSYLSDRKLIRRALSDNNRAVNLSPEFSQAWLERGMTYEALGLPTLAIADYNKSISIEPTGRAYYNRGVSKWNMIKDNLKKPGVLVQLAQPVLDDYQQAIKLNSDLESAYNNRGVIYMHLGQFQRAIEELSRAIESIPDDPDATHYRFFNRAVCYENLGPRYSDLGNLQKAINDYGSALELSPSYVPALINRAICYEFLSVRGRYGDPKNVILAIHDYDKILELQPNNPSVFFNRGWAYEAIGDIPKALLDFKAFVKLSKEKQTVKQIREHILDLSKKM